MSVSLIVKKEDPAIEKLIKTICNEYFYQVSVGAGNDDFANYNRLADLIEKALTVPYVLELLLLERGKVK